MAKPGWFDYQRAMPTLWGKADSVTRIEPGVMWVTTPGHGGLLVGKAVARRTLSPRAIALAERCGPFYAFEEDCAYAVAFLERYEWEEALAGANGQPPIPYGELLQTVKRWFPQYFRIGGES